MTSGKHNLSRRSLLTSARNISLLLLLETPKKVLALSAPKMRRALRAAGSTIKLSVWGLNTSGRLGVGNLTNQTSPTDVTVYTLPPLAVSAGGSHSLVINSDGTLWASGANTAGQLGVGDITTRSSYVQVGSATNWTKISAGDSHSFGIKADGTLWAWGSNVYGQLGTSDLINRSTPVQIGAETIWSKVLAGYRCSYGVKTNGQLWAWGSNEYGQLGQVVGTPIELFPGSTWNSFATRVDMWDGTGNLELAGTVAIRNDGTLWAWGENLNGTVGDGTRVTKESPTQIGVFTDWVQVSVSPFHTAGVRLNGTLWTWGLNSDGQLGYGPLTSRSSPMQVGSATDWAYVCVGDYHSVGIKTDGSLWSWGYNNKGQLGLGDRTRRSTPVRVGTDTDWANAVIGEMFTVALKTTGALYSWGNNVNGELGMNDQFTSARSVPGTIGTDTTWVEICAAGMHAAGRKSDGTLWSWGDSTNGEVGTGSTADFYSPVQVGTRTDWTSIGVGYYASYGITSDGNMWSWGYSNPEWPNLGNGILSSRSTPVLVSNSTWNKIQGAAFGAVATKSDKTLWAWGRSIWGSLGKQYTSPVRVGTLTNWADIAAGTQHFLGRQSTGRIWHMGASFQLNQSQSDFFCSCSPISVGSLTTWTKIASGGRFNLAVRNDGTGWAWGEGSAGQLGQSNTTSRSSPLQLPGTGWANVAAGTNFSIGMKTDNTVFTWGSNTNGELGSGTTTPRSSPEQITLANWAEISAGTSHVLTRKN